MKQWIVNNGTNTIRLGIVPKVAYTGKRDLIAGTHQQNSVTLLTIDLCLVKCRLHVNFIY